VTIDPDRVARGLSIAEQQLVEIAKALSIDAKVIVMDEPTAALSAAEVDRLANVITALRDHGAAVLFHLAPSRGGLPPLPTSDRSARRSLGFSRREPTP